ncbi:MAG: hypothetical protein IKG00_02095 [Lachnospiraceae bacterium]|nr:hypothetical protein [Lachnospiraceae bacterium]
MKFIEYQKMLPAEILETVQNIHDELSAMGFTEEIKEAKSGPVLSYMKDRKVLLNYVYRKSGIKVRLYAAEIAAYEDCLAGLPDSMKKELKKATDCKKLNGLTCTPTCPGGYAYTLDGELLKKCRSMAFLMTLNQKTAEYIHTLILREAKER